MTHAEVVERDLVDAYVAGTLTAADRAAFEAHYFECDACFEALQAADALRGGVRLLAATGELDAGERAAPLMPWFLAAAALVLAAAGGWMLESQIGGLRRDLGSAQQRSADLERALASARTPGPVAAPQIASAEPEANVPLAILQTTRAQSSATALTVPAAARTFIVWLEDAPALDGTGALALIAADGRTRHTVAGLRPNRGGAIVASFPTSGIAAGTYTLRLTAAGQPRPIGEYRLTIARP